jgi:hypothetical protein
VAELVTPLSLVFIFLCLVLPDFMERSPVLVPALPVGPALEPACPVCAAVEPDWPACPVCPAVEPDCPLLEPDWADRPPAKTRTGNATEVNRVTMLLICLTFLLHLSDVVRQRSLPRLITKTRDTRIGLTGSHRNGERSDLSRRNGATRNGSVPK